MRWQLPIIGIVAAMAQGAKLPAPSQLYIVSESFSDYGAAMYYRVIEVKPDGPDTVIRYSRIAPVDIFCRRTIVQSAEARVRGTSPAELIKTNNPCAVGRDALMPRSRDIP